MQLTAQVQLMPDDVQAAALLATMKRFNEVCNYVSKIAFEHRCYHPIALHNLKIGETSLYFNIRANFPEITASFVPQVFRKVSDAYKFATKKNKINKKCYFKYTGAVNYNNQLLRIINTESSNNTGFLTIATIIGRAKMHFIFGDHQRKLYGKIGEIKLIYNNHRFYLNISTEQPNTQLIIPTSYLGVDLGISNIATISSGKIYTGAQIDQLRTKYQTHRSSLQKCGSKSAKRRLKLVSGKEANFRKDINHCISKKIVATAKGTNSGIVLEDLTHIREQITVRRKQRSRHHGWSFAQLRLFISYKAKMVGIPVLYVDPRHTSQRCSGCGHTERKNRKSQFRFSCLKCGHDAHADYNAACNLAMMGFTNAS